MLHYTILHSSIYVQYRDPYLGHFSLFALIPLHFFSPFFSCTALALANTHFYLPSILSNHENNANQVTLQIVALISMILSRSDSETDVDALWKKFSSGHSREDIL